MTRTGRLLVALAAASALLFVVPMTATAEVALCDGHEATIVGDGTVDPIVGTADGDVIVASSGKDVIKGKGGDDIICGGGGGDIIYGGAGDDIIWGQGGHDKLRGGTGDDELRGGSGNDRLWGKSDVDTAKAGSGSDVCKAEDESNCELNKRWGHDPDDWLPLLEEYFGDIGETANARVVMGCESLGEPFIVHPDPEADGQPTGLFQYKDWIWDWMNPLTPNWAGEVRQHPEASIATARTHYEWALENQDYGWAPWTNCGCHPDIDSPDKPGDCNYKP